MWRSICWMLVLSVFVFSGVRASAAGELTHPITLYQEAVKVDNMVKSADPSGKVLPALDHLADLYTRLDPQSVQQRVEGVQAVTTELLALKQMYAAIKGPEQSVAEYRMHRIVMAFDSLAYPNSPAWLPVARTMENNLEKTIEAVAKGDQKLARSTFAKVRSERDEIWLALQLHGDPSELNLQQSAHKFVEGQLAGEQVTDKQGVLDALGSYKASLGHMTAKMPVVQDPPILPVFHVTLDPVTYGTATGAVLLFGGWRVYRRKKKN